MRPGLYVYQKKGGSPTDKFTLRITQWGAPNSLIFDAGNRDVLALKGAGFSVRSTGMGYWVPRLEIEKAVNVLTKAGYEMAKQIGEAANNRYARKIREHVREFFEILSDTPARPAADRRWVDVERFLKSDSVADYMAAWSNMRDLLDSATVKRLPEQNKLVQLADAVRKQISDWYAQYEQEDPPANGNGTTNGDGEEPSPDDDDDDDDDEPKKKPRVPIVVWLGNPEPHSCRKCDNYENTRCTEQEDVAAEHGRKALLRWLAKPTKRNTCSLFEKLDEILLQPFNPLLALWEEPEIATKKEKNKETGEEEYPFKLSDLQSYYDLQIAAGMTPPEAVAKVKKRFKLKKVKVNPAGEIQPLDGLKKEPEPPPPPPPPEEKPGEEPEEEPPPGEEEPQKPPERPTGGQKPPTKGKKPPGVPPKGKKPAESLPAAFVRDLSGEFDGDDEARELLQALYGE